MYGRLDAGVNGLTPYKCPELILRVGAYYDSSYILLMTL
jgi:hypothetical protein